jgi:hypothetical protein
MKRHAPSISEKSGPKSVARPGTKTGRIALSEALEVVEDCQCFLGAQLERALMGKDDETACDIGEMPKDADASARIALIAMDRSISAWGALAVGLPSHKRRTAEIIGRLKQIRDVAEKEFPKGRSEIRPGCDE